MNMRKLLSAVVVALALSISLNACGKKLPDPVERKDGYAYIPIADTAFLVPEKTWLKSYGRKSTDGSVDSFYLHVTAPDVQPWSEAVNAKMYPERGRGAIVEISVTDVRHTEFHRRFPNFPQSRWGGSPLKEEPSDLENVGLRKFRDSAPTDSGLDKVFYEFVKNEQVKYFIRCGDHRGYMGAHDSCYLSFPFGNALEVELTFNRKYMPESVRMADKIAAKLKEFEAAGRARPTTPVDK
jgi:hypothetical protein